MANGTAVWWRKIKAQYTWWKVHTQNRKETDNVYFLRWKIFIGKIAGRENILSYTNSNAGHFGMQTVG